MYFQSLITITVLASVATALAPLFTDGPDKGTLVPDRYIVKFKHDAIMTSSLHNHKAAAHLVYESSGFHGFAGHLDSDSLKRLRESDAVEFVEQDFQINPLDGFTGEHKGHFIEEENATWGLARMSSKDLDSTVYTYDSTAGEGTCAYVIDSGIAIDHEEFQGRAKFLKDFSDEDSSRDGLGHGTHVAGILGGKTFGVAKKVQLLAVKVLRTSDGTGLKSFALAGMNFVAQDAPRRRKDCPNGEVANMSLRFDPSRAIEAAGRHMIQAGVFVAVSAGNNASDASWQSPASESSLFCVGSIDKDNRIAETSNYGSLVDIFAPGEDILSAWPKPYCRTDATHVLSGTSMATPAVAGLAAYLLSIEGPMGPAELTKRIKKLGRRGVVEGIPEDTTTVNLLAYNGADELGYPKRVGNGGGIH